MKCTFLFLSIGLIIISCKREKKDFIGPDLAIASNNFEVLTPFSIDSDPINFVTDSNWFQAEFNERVSWTVKIIGTQSKAEKIIKGVSKVIDKNNSIWSGGHDGLYFFKAGEKVKAELSVFGTNDKWVDSATISLEKTNYGSDVIVWWDMNSVGVARNGVSAYWFDFYDGDVNPTVVGVGERLLTGMEVSPRIDNGPVQGIYRSIEGKDGIGASDYYIGGMGHSPIGGKGFDEPLENLYLNFYLRRRTNTTGLGIGLVSKNLSGATSTLTYNQGEITWEGWKLVSIRLSDMQLTAGNPAFFPLRITQFNANLQIVSAPGVDQAGIDIDFITITKNGPFNPKN